MKKLLALLVAGLTALTVTACADHGAVTLPDYSTSQAVENTAQESAEYTAPQTSESADAQSEASPAQTEAAPTDEVTPAGELTPTGETTPADESAESAQAAPAEPALDEHGAYTTRNDVALYIHLYGRLPENFITKKQAQELGWNGGSLEPYAEGRCIGGSRFGNYEGLLPEKDGRVYTECDIDTLGADSRGAKRIVFSNDGLIYYTDDHYKSFTLLYRAE